MVLRTLSTSVEIPFSAERTRVLMFAEEEVDRLQHDQFGTEPLLLDVLRDGQSVAGSILMEPGMHLAAVREDVVSLVSGNEQAGSE